MSVRRLALASVVLTGCALPLVVSSAALASPSAAGGHDRSAANRAARSLCAPPADTVGPIVTKVAFGRPSIDLNTGSRVQTLTAAASDTSGNGAPSGVAHLVLEIRGNRYFALVKPKLASGTPASGRWKARFTISKYAHPGKYTIEFIDATDAAGNAQDYQGYGRTPEGPNALSLNPADNPTFTVTGTPAVRPHKPAGNLSTLSFSTATVNTTHTARRMRVAAHFTGAQPSRVEVTFYSAQKARHARFIYLHGILHRHDSRWTGTVLVARWLGKQVVQAQLFASYGAGFRPSERGYDSEQLQRLHLPYKLSIVSGVDTSRPVLKSVSFSPKSINSTNGTERVTVTAHATDTGSGVRYLSVSGGIRNGDNGVPTGLYPFAAGGIGYLSDNNFTARLHRTPSGAWVGTTNVRQCVPSGKYKLDVFLRDAADNYRSYSSRQLAKAGITSTVNVKSKHGDVEPPYVYSAATYGADREVFLNFSEGVANVTTSTLTVYPLSPASTRYRTTSDITGITCSNGTSTVDCSGSGGLVTSAILFVSGLTVGDKYEVFANLNQVTTQLVDGNGNPLQWNNGATEVQDS